MNHNLGTFGVPAIVRRLLLVVLICLFTLTACRKEDGSPTPTPSSSGGDTATPGSGGDQPSELPERSAPGIVVSPVTGNTAALNSVAEFSVQLAGAPIADVTIGVASSNEGEGVPDQAELVFTPQNWFQPQIVVVRGTNGNVVNGEQDYQIVLAPAGSSDPLYNGLDPEDVAMKGLELLLASPDNLNGFVANVQTTIQPQVKYSGSNLLSFALTGAPAGMSIDLSSGLISWTPQESDEGQTFAVGVTVNDGNKFAQTDFQVTVVQPIPLAVEIEGNTLRVVDESSSLNGMTITQLDGDNAQLSQLNLGKLDAAAGPTTPEWVTTLSDIFVVKGSFTQNIELRFSLDNLPEDVSIGAVNLHAFIEALDVDSQFWSPVFIESNYEGTSDSPVIVVTLGGLEGMAVWGYTTTPEPNQLSGFDNDRNRPVSGKMANDLPSQTSPACVQQKGPAPQEALLDKYVCTASQLIGTQSVTSTITIAGWGLSKDTNHWGGVTMNQLVADLLAAQVWFANHQLGYDKTFNVSIHRMDNIYTFGYVTTGNYENRKTLHLTNDDTKPSSEMRGTFIHEYFHHAQGHSDTRMENKDLLIDGPQGAWFVEGTARWFEDQLFDSLDTYIYMEGGWGNKIAEVGIDRAQYGNGTERPYQRFSFFKLLTKSCPQFDSNFRAFLNVNLTEDPSGIKNLNNLLAGCNFGDHFGADKAASLEAALAYYNYATQFENKISLLDTGEPDTRFAFDKPSFGFSGYWSSTDLWVASGTAVDLLNVSNIPAAGAYSFKVPAVSGQLPAGKIAELIVDSDQTLFVSIVSADSQFQGLNALGNRPHSWFTTTDQASYIYTANNTVPELFVTIVNPNLTNRAIVKVSFQIRDAQTATPTITSHATGAQVSNRVITIAGEIPTEARGTTNSVVLTVNGIATTVPMNSDGTYSVEAVVTLGQNIIKVQGFNGATPTTNVKVITLQGVESASAGINALIPSRAVFVLRWNTDQTDVDIYSTDKDNNTIWYSSTIVGPGYLDHDDTTGYGPEVVSYRATGDTIYINGTFNLDVHYYAGSAPTNFTLDVILNETEGDNRRVLRFQSITQLPSGNGSENSPTGAGASRFNDIVTISCSDKGVCSLSGYSAAILAEYGRATPQ